MRGEATRRKKRELEASGFRFSGEAKVLIFGGETRVAEREKPTQVMRFVGHSKHIL